MEDIRLKVEISQEKSSNSSRKTSVQPLKFVYILNLNYTYTVDDLRTSLEKYIAQQYSTNIQISQIMTYDGYHLSDDYSCSQVFKDNDQILCCDMGHFVQENYSTLDFSNLWCEMKRHDASDDEEKCVQVGLTHQGNLFVRMYGTSKIYGLYIFRPLQLFNMVHRSPDIKLIARLGKQNWFLEAEWENDRDSRERIFLICNLKLGTNEQIWSNEIQILLNESEESFEKGEITCLSGGIDAENILSEEKRERLQQLAASIPPPIHTGPQIDTDKDANKSITKHECQSDSLIQMACGNTHKIVTNQSWYAKEDGTFQQHITIEHINFIPKSDESSTKKNLSVLNINVLYEDMNGTWCECNDVAIGPISLRNEQPNWLANSIINFENDQIVSYTIKASILVKGKPGSDNFRRSLVHKSLPQPLKLKIVLQDNFDKQSSLIVEQLNKPLDIETSTSFTKYNQSSISELLAFVYADDCETDERIFFAVYLNKDDEIVINSDRSYSITLNRQYIRTMEFNAKQKQTFEIPFDSIYYQYETREKKAVGLFDEETFMFYAIRFKITTHTSETQETVFVPIEKVK